MKNLIFLLFIIAGTPLMAQQSGELSVPLSEPGKKAKLTIDINRGSIIINGTSRKDIYLKYSATENKQQKKQNEGGLTRISGGTMDLEISENNNHVKIESGSWQTGVDLTVEIPENADLNVKTYNNGNITIKNVAGEIVIQNYNGDITAESISGSVVATTYNGPIKVTFNNITPDAPMAFSTYNGNIDLTLPPGTKGSLKMKTSQGDIYSGFEMDVKKSEPVKKEDKKYGTYKVYIDDWVRADINGGGPEIMIKNYNGDIFLRKRK